MTNLLKQIKKTSDEMYDIYDIKVRYRGRMIGGVPKQLDLALIAAEAKLRKAKAPEEVVDNIKKEFSDRIAEAEAARELIKDSELFEDGDDDEKEHPVVHSAWCGFWEDEEGIYVESRTMKSALRECLSKLGYFMKNRGSKGHHDYGLFIEPTRLRFTREIAGHNRPITKPDGFQDRAITVSTPQGKRTSIKREDYVENGEMSFRVKSIKNGKISRDGLIQALALLQDAGYGAARSQGFGQLDILECEETRAPRPKPKKSE